MEPRNEFNPNRRRWLDKAHGDSLCDELQTNPAVTTDTVRKTPGWNLDPLLDSRDRKWSSPVQSVSPEENGICSSNNFTRGVWASLASL